MRIRRRRVFWLFLPLLLAVAVGVATRPVVLDRVVAAIGPTVRTRGLAIGWGLRVTARRISLRDATGVWLTVRGARLDWSPLALLRGAIRVRSLSARAVALARMPVAAPGGPSGGDPLATWRALPARISIGTIAIERLEIAAGAAPGAPAEVLRVAGAFLRDGADHGSARLTLRQLGGTTRAKLQARWDPRGLDAGLNLFAPSGGPLQRLSGADAAGLTGPLAVHARIAGKLAALAVTARVTLPPGSARLRGTLDLPARRGRVRLHGALTGKLTVAGLRIAGGQLRARLHGAFAAPSGEVVLTATGLRDAGASLARVRARARLTAGTIRLAGTATGLRLPGPAGGLLGGTVRIRARRAASGSRVRVRLTSALGAVRGVVSLASGAEAVRARLTLPDLTKLAALAGVPARGQAELHLGAMLSAGAVRFRVGGAARLTQGPGPTVALLGPASLIALNGRYQAGRLTVRRASLQAGGLTLRGSATAARGRIHARFQAGLPDLAVVVPSLAGALRFDGEVSGAPVDLALTGRMTGQITTAGVGPACPAGGCALTAAVSLTGLPGAPRGRVTADGALLGAPLSLALRLAPDANGTARLEIARASWRSLRASGAVRMAGALPLGHLVLHIGSLADFAPLLGRPLGLPLAGSLEATLRSTRERTELIATAQGLRAGTSALAAARLTATVVAPATAPSLTADLRLDGLAAAGVTGSARLSATGPLRRPDLRLAAAVTRSAAGRLTLRAAGQATLAPPALRLTALDAQARGLALRILAPLRLTLAGGEVTLDRLDADLAGGRLVAAGRIGRTLALRARLTGLPVAVVDGFAPGLRAAGTMSASADLTGPVTAPSGQVQVLAEGLRLLSGPGRAAPKLRIAATAHLAGMRRALQATATAGTSRLTLDGTVTGTRLALRLDGGLDAGLANPLLAAGGMHVIGHVALAGRIGGTTTAPVLGGTATLAGGGFEDLALGVHLREIAGSMTGSGTGLRIALGAHAGAGTLALSGTLGLGRGLPAALRLVAHDATPLESPLITAALDADLALDGMLRPAGAVPARLSGSVTLRQATIRIPAALPASVRTLPVRWADAPPPRPVSAGPTIALPLLALRVVAPRRIFVRGRGLDAEFGGSVTLTGPAAAPLARGGFHLIRGSMTLPGQSLAFTSGSIRFTGAGIADPALDLVARSVSGDTTATLAITGTASAPRIRLSSVPALPSDQVLARLLFHTGANQLSPLQIASLAAGLAQLSGEGPDLPDPVGALRQALGLSTLGMGSGGSSVQAGRYLGSRLYVGAEQSTGGSGTRGTVRYDLTKHLQLHGSAGVGESTSALGAAGQTSGENIGLRYHLAY